MLSEGMNSTRNFVFVVLVATQGIIGQKTTLNPIEGQTDDILRLTTLSNRNGDDQERTGSTKLTINTTEEQTTRSDDISSSVLYAYEAPTENNLESTKIVRNSATTKEIFEDLETSDGEITTVISHHSPTSHTVEHSIRKDMSNNNEIEVSEKNAIDKKTTNKTPQNATADDRYVIIDTTTEQPYREPVDVSTAINYDDDDIDDFIERTTNQDTEKATTDLLKEDDDVDITKFYRRMFEISHSLEDSNNKPETVARMSTTKTSLQDHSPLIHIEKSHDPYRDNSRMSHDENNRQSYEDHSHLSHQAKSQQSYDVRQNYPTPVTPPYIHTNTHQGPYLNSRSGQFFTSSSGQSESFENERRSPQARPQFINNQRFINNPPQPPPPQFMQQSFEQLQPQLQPQTHPYHPQPQQQQHLPMQLQYPWPTVQPMPNHMDNLLASLQQASLHPVLSAKQYKDFYEKQYIYPRNPF